MRRRCLVTKDDDPGSFSVRNVRATKDKWLSSVQ